MPIPRPIRSVAGEGSSRPRALPPIHLPSPSAAGRFEPVLRRFEPVRADSSSSTATPPLKPISAPSLTPVSLLPTGPPSQGRQAGGPAGPLRSSLTQAHGWISHGSGKDWSGSSLLRRSYRVAFHWRQCNCYMAQPMACSVGKLPDSLAGRDP
ncbi:hypothetical protein SETIT_6G122700v2 [Setaria italica]|uniref:Uncharacterized protein n=1 Tax=Setaria italica TaxID=4555 RepID=A0A368RKR1_SETIT|nr:hypothetical protein SETIT_6G122700v2 [Setaria italica]